MIHCLNSKATSRIDVLNGEEGSCCHHECWMNRDGNVTGSCSRSTAQCHYLGGLSEQCRRVYSRSSNLVFLIFDSDKKHGNSELFWIPKLDYLCWNGQKVSNCDVHVVFYDPPVYNHHYFSLQPSNSYEQENSSFKKPKWVDELQQKGSSFDLDTVILAINCAAAAKRPLESHLHAKSSLQFSIVDRCYSFMWSLLAVSIASLSTLFYMTFQLSYKLHSLGLQLWTSDVVSKIFMTSYNNAHIRCCQILYWPIILQECGVGFLSNVEYEEKVALQRHSMWSSIAADIFLGNVVGVALLCYADSTCSLIVNLARDVTNNILRTGCVWLMGVPAGFKLNIELTGVLGIVSLNAIQIWSTVWFFFSFIFIYVVKALAILGILFGGTLPAAFTSDLISVASCHVSTLHWFFSLIYSSQIQALAALWRLFRGQKQNPLRKRIDSYDYIVKQHVVGSLIFTPLLLLLPTTSVFYVFFTILNSSISFIKLLIEVIISAIHATPYAKIYLWLVKRKRFPSGIWFEIISCHINSTGCPDKNFSENVDLPTKILERSEEVVVGRSSVLVSCLHSNLMGIGELVLPHYRNIFSGFSQSVLASTFHGVLTGTRTTSTLKAGLPSPLPWMCIPYRKYWHLCHDSILTCRQTPPCTS
ncbi:N-acetylglucosaminyl-phosphatidylinositol biosynthetic protein gpi1 isoform X3 [Cucurbita moschata]|uniref:N-acetylglucosaminyl-phosphatidylinositol biosynthetic protein gpi1 isoform X3 n=1 Tax=Cucurbita moschata TaxID=3662 RepID=A0A6J1EB04_CUCMO|nr:N-acetylglucosaminyl-phosphatidylinositol biosynthetic protein gpi1 isoform X3 [Cucurbita moschata]